MTTLLELAPRETDLAAVRLDVPYQDRMQTLHEISACGYKTCTCDNGTSDCPQTNSDTSLAEVN